MLNKKEIIINKYNFEYFGKLIELKRTEEQIEKYKKGVIEYKKRKKNEKDYELVKYLRDKYDKNDAENIEFCEFRLESFSDTSTSLSGVYLWVVDDEFKDDKIKYVGETINMKKRFNNGYGHISPRNIFKGGQSTNCRMNKVALNLFKQGKEIYIYFCKASKSESEQIEKEILDYYKNGNKSYLLLNIQNNKL